LLSSQIMQNTIEGLKTITRREFAIIEREGRVVAATEPDMLNKQITAAADFVNSAADSQSVSGYQYFKVFDNGVAEYAVLIQGEDEETYRLGKIAAFQVGGLIVAYKERFDRDNFVKNLLLDNMLLVDIYSRAKKLRIETAARRVVYLIESDVGQDPGAAVETVRNIFPAKNKDFVTAIDEKHIILCKELKAKDGIEEIEKNANIIVDTLSSETMNSVRVAIGTAVSDIKFVSNSYKEARHALEVGKIFDAQKLIVNYERLGVGRLIYQLPVSLCRMFINEVLGEFDADNLDDETFATVSKFFDNNLNVSETSRQLYIHRNTLVYRLDKLMKGTGLDLRNFDDAIIFKITLMVNKYLKYKENRSV